MKRGEVFNEVQAALLNSSGDPGDEVESALYAVVEFAMLECGRDLGALQALMSSVVSHVVKEQAGT